MKIREYDVGELLYESSRFRLYACSLPDGRTGILKIAATAEENAALDREVFILQKLSADAEKLEAEFLASHHDPGRKLGLHIAFPALVDSFVCDEQGGRQVNVLHLAAAVPGLQDLAPLQFIVERDRARVDPKTSVWMLGKMLKLLAFVHGAGVSTGDAITAENFAVNRGLHYVVLIDWTTAEVRDGGVPPSVAGEEIARAAREVVAALGGDPETGEIPPDEQLADNRYGAILAALVSREFGDAARAHEEFYATVESLWPKGFHAYTTYPNTK